MLAPSARIFVATKTVDFRGSFDRLAGIVRERLGDDPRSGSFYVFFNRAADSPPCQTSASHYTKLYSLSQKTKNVV